MLKESSDKFHRVKVCGFPCFPLTVFIQKPDIIVLNGFNAVIGNSAPEDVSGKLPQGVLPFSRRLTVYDPFLLPGVGVYLMIKFSCLHSIPELCSKDKCQWFCVNE